MSDRVGVARTGFARPSYRPERSGGLDPDLRRMAMVAIAMGAGLAAVIGAASLLHRTHHGIPVILAQPGPVRVKPADPGGMKVMGADDAPSGAVEKLAPPPERPQIAALRARVKAAKAAAHAEVAETKPAAAKALPVVASPTPQKASLMQEAPAASATSVQFAAFDTQDAAERDWGRLAVKMPGLLGTRKPEVVKVDLHGRTLWRLRTGGFASLAQAHEFCEKIHVQGSDCSVAAF